MQKLLLLLIPLFFSIHQVLVRRGSQDLDAFTGTYVSLLTSTIMFSPAVVYLPRVSTSFLLLMIGAGLVHFLAARLCFYHAIERIGANLSAPLSATRIFFAAIIGFMIGEAITPKIVAMGVLIFAGIILLSRPEGKADLIGITLGVMTGFFSALSSMLVKIGMVEEFNPLLGAFLGFAVATAIMTPFSIKRLDFRTGKWYAYAGIFVGLGHLVRYFCLRFLPIAVIEPITSIYPLFTILLSYIFIRESEVFGKEVILGAILIVVGANIYFI